MYRYIIHLTYLICLKAVVFPVDAGSLNNTLNFFSLTGADGLSNNHVTAIERDSCGYLWFGTQNGLNRYNGYDFSNYYSVGNDTTSLPGNHISSLQADGAGKLWIGCHSAGIARYDPGSDTFIRYDLQAITDEALPVHVYDVVADKSGVIWSSTSEGIIVYDTKQDDFTQVPFLEPVDGETKELDSVNAVRVYNEGIAAIVADDMGCLWVVHTDWSLTCIDLAGNSSRYYYEMKSQLGNQKDKPLHLDYHDGKLFIATGNSGVLVFDVQNRSIYRLPGTEELRNPRYIREHDGVLWISALTGLHSYEMATGLHNNYEHDPENPKSITSGSVGALYIGETGVLWLAAGNTGINYAITGMPFMNLYENQENSELLFHPNVSALLHDSNNNFWIAFQSGLIQLYRECTSHREMIPVEPLISGAGIGHIFRIFEASDGDIYITSWQGGLQKFDPAAGRFVSIVSGHDEFIEKFGALDIRDVAEGPDGALWLAVFGRGLARYEPGTGLVTWFRYGTGLPGSLSNNHIYSLEYDKYGNLWVSTVMGLNILMPGDSVFVTYLVEDEQGSLPDNYIHFSYRDRSDRMWVVSNGGISLYNPDLGNFTSITPGSLGLPGLLIRSIAEDDAGNLWLGTTAGIINIMLRFPEKYIFELHNASIYDVNHGLLSDDFFPRSVSHDHSGTLYFGGNRGLDFFDPGMISSGEIQGPVLVEDIRLFDRTVFPGGCDGPRINNEGSIVFSHRENMIGFEYAMLNFVGSIRNRYYYMLEPLHDEWVNAGTQKRITFVNLKPGHYTFRVMSCPAAAPCDNQTASVSFIITPPFWQTNWFTVLATVLFISLTVLFHLIWTASIRRRKHELEVVVKKRTNQIREKNLELERRGEYLTEANRKIYERSRELETKNEEIGRQAGELRLLNSMKDKFFSIIAHDLRSPLSALSGLSGLVLRSYENYNDEKRKKMIGIINDSARKMIIMLDNLLQWANSQTGRVFIKNEEISPSQVLNETCSLYKELIEEKNISFIIRVPEDIKLVTDLEMFRVVLRNLLSNAIKFTPAGGTIKASGRITEKGELQIDITDSGIGVPGEIAANLFKTVKPSTMPGTHGETGTGLGLILCKEFIDKLGGRIWVGKTSEEGTTFCFTLPLDGSAGHK